MITCKSDVFVGPHLRSLEGQTFERLTILKDGWQKDKNGNLYCKCQCVCGTVKSIRLDHLRGKRVKSCRCYRKSVAGNNTRKAPYQWLYTILRRTCRQPNRQNKPCSLTFNEFLTFTSIPTCHYCGNHITWPPYQSVHSNGKLASHAYYLDRKDNALGYTKDNCVVCCSLCNRVKGHCLTYSEMMSLGPSLRRIKDSRLTGQPL